MTEQEIINKWEGQDLGDNLGNRVAGLAKLVLGTVALSADSTLADVFGYLFIVDGFGDLVSGKHHYISSRVFRFHPKYSS